MSALTKVVATVAALGLLVPVAFARDLPVTGSTTVGVRTSDDDSSSEVEDRDDLDDDSDDIDDDRGGDSRIIGASNRATTTAGIENRSAVSVRVQELLNAADRDGGIGEEVRDIAHEYASSSERASEARERVEGRPGWLVFIIGTDYGNLGKLRSEIETTQNQIQRLTSAMDRATDASVKAALQTQIDALEAQASTTEAFVEDNENSFSVLGWFFKLFSS